MTIRISARAGSLTARSTASTSGPKARNFGKIKETHRQIIVEGHVLARMATKNDWLGPDGKPNMRRRCAHVTFYRTQRSRVIDFEFTIHASDGPVTFGDTKEGMFGIRVASSMDVYEEDRRPDHQRRGTDRRESLGKGISVGRLRRAGERQNGRHRGAQSPRQLSLSHHLARAALTVSLPPIRSAGTTSASPSAGDYTVPSGEIDELRLPRHPSRG